MSSNDPPIILKGTYTSRSGIKLPYKAYDIGNKVVIEFNGISASIAKIFPGWEGKRIIVSNTEFENLKNIMNNNPLEPWIVIHCRTGQQVEIPGTWTTETSGGKKRSGHKRKSQKKRSGKKRSGKKRSDKKSRRH